MILYIVLSFSVVVNIFFVWYIRQLLIRFNYFSKNFEAFEDMVQGYQDHLENVYGLETFYGDSTLQGLLNHTKDFSEFVTGMKVNFEIEKEEE